MASQTTNITTITRGNDVTLKFTITSSVALASARLVVKRKAKDADDDAIVNKSVTTVLGANGQITTVSSGVYLVRIFLAKSLTDDFIANKDYQYDLEVFDEDGNATTPVGGTITLKERVRIATG